MTVYQKNMHYDADGIGDLVADIFEAQPEIVTLQEVSIANETLLARLSNAYPPQHLCRYSTSNGTAVLSRFEAVGSPICGHGLGLAAVPLETESGPVRAASWPAFIWWPNKMPQMRPISQGRSPGTFTISLIIADHSAKQLVE